MTTNGGICETCEAEFQLDAQGELEPVIRSNPERATCRYAVTTPRSIVPPALAGLVGSPHASAKNELCQDCNRHQRIISELLRDFSGSNDRPTDVAAYGRSLELKYPLCGCCAAKVARKLETQQSFLQLGYHVKQTQAQTRHGGLFWSSWRLQRERRPVPLLETLFATFYMAPYGLTRISFLAQDFSLWLLGALGIVLVAQLGLLGRLSAPNVAFKLLALTFLCVRCLVTWQVLLRGIFVAWDVLVLDIVAWLCVVRPSLVLAIMGVARASRAPSSSSSLTANPFLVEGSKGSRQMQVGLGTESQRGILSPRASPSTGFPLAGPSSRIRPSFERSFVDSDGLWVSSPFAASDQASHVTTPGGSFRSIRKSVSDLPSFFPLSLSPNSLSSSPSSTLHRSAVDENLGVSMQNTRLRRQQLDKQSASRSHVASILRPSLLEASTLGLEESFAKCRLDEGLPRVPFYLNRPHVLFISLLLLIFACLLFVILSVQSHLVDSFSFFLKGSSLAFLGRAAPCDTCLDSCLTNPSLSFFSYFSDIIISYMNSFCEFLL